MGSETASGSEEHKVPLQHERPDHLPPHPDPDDEDQDTIDVALLLFRALTIITSVSAVLCMIVNTVSLMRTFKWKIDTFVGLLRCYAVVLAFFVVIAETEWSRLFRYIPLLEYWLGRGMLQIFVAIMTKALVRASGETRAESLLHDIASWMLLGCGAFYSLAGILCMGNLKRRRMNKRHWREQAFKDLEDIEKRKKELQGLLGTRGRADV